MTDGKRTFIGNKTCRLAIKVKAGTTGCNITCPELDEALADATATYKTGVTAADKKGLFEGEQSNPDKEYDDDGNMYQTWYIQISEKNAASQFFNFTLTNQLNSENDYITHFQLKTMYMSKNPLWWMAQYNVDQIKGVKSFTGTTFRAVQSTNNERGYDPYSAMYTATGGSSKMEYYHLPTVSEWTTVVPSDVEGDQNSSAIWSWSGAKTERSCTIGGESVTSPKSIWKKVGSDLYAIRFYGTEYASAWHYKYVSTPCTGLFIESYLVDAQDQSTAQTLLNSISSSSTWINNYNENSETSNLSPEEENITNHVQRFLPTSGFSSTDGEYTSSENDNFGSYHSVIVNGNKEFYLNFNGSSHGFIVYWSAARKGTVRLFFDYE